MVLIAAGVVVVVGAALGLYFGLSGGGSAPPGTASPTSSPSASPVAGFAFDIASVRTLPVVPRKGVARAAHDAAPHIGTTLDRLYGAAFLEPSAWRTGHYADAWDVFTNQVIGEARRSEGTLTLGAHAGSTFASVLHGSGRLDLRVLTDRLGHPSTAVATVSFAARGNEKSGRSDVIQSTGHYFLRPTPHGWAIYAFDVRRGDHRVRPKKSKAASPTTGASP